jgi:hypothetical protein
VVKSVGLADVAVKADGEKLSQNVNPIQFAVDAVTDGNIDQTVLGSQRHRRFCSNLRQREKSRSATTAQNQCNRIFHGCPNPFELKNFLPPGDKRITGPDPGAHHRSLRHLTTYRRCRESHRYQYFS